MKKLGKELVFISQINRDGSGVSTPSNDYIEYMKNDEFLLTRLSISKDTYLASAFNSFVVRIK